MSLAFFIILRANICTAKIRNPVASLRWHYPNQVRSRGIAPPLSRPRLNAGSARTVRTRNRKYLFDHDFPPFFCHEKKKGHPSRDVPGFFYHPPRKYLHGKDLKPCRFPTLALSKSGKVEGNRPSSQPPAGSSLAWVIVSSQAGFVKIDHHKTRLFRYVRSLSPCART